MRIHTLMQLGFKKVDNAQFLESMKFFKEWGYNFFTTCKYDESLDETFKVWALNKDDFTELFQGMNGAIITTILGIYYRNSFYANPLILDFFSPKSIAA